MHDGPVWPLHLKPQDTILSPTYQLGSRNTSKPWPPSGDRIGECFSDVLTLGEMVELCCRMSETWERGVRILNELDPGYRDEPERILDINVATALGILFRSGYNILYFYLLREKMLYKENEDQLETLQALISILQQEQNLSEQLALLCEKDARLGYHPDAEGHKYFPEKLRWRIQQLQNVLDNEVPEIQRSIAKGEVLFPEYTGEKSSGVVAYARDPNQLDWQTCACGAQENNMQWAANVDGDSLIINMRNISLPKSTFVRAIIKIEPRRLWPVKRFFHTFQEEEDFAKIRIPLDKIGLEKSLRPIRLDIQIQMDNGEMVTWRPQNPLDPRLLLGSDNPADLGWLIFT
jgi:hypothetical protein